MMSKVKSQNAKIKTTRPAFAGTPNSKFKFLLLSCGFALLLFTFTFHCYAASVWQNVKTANKFYQRGKIDEALEKYNEAAVSMPDSDIINFNMGAALYKKEDYQKAQEAFTRALTSDNKKLEADALYNLGNCKYKLGKLKENTDLSATVAHLRESLDYYKRAVELDQKNEEARFNHEFVERELKVLLDKLKQQNEQSVQTQEQKEGQKEQEEAAHAKEEQQERQEQEESTSIQEQAQQEGEEKKLTEEQARVLLERYGKDEAAPDYIDRHTRGYEREVLKDW